MLFRTLTRLCEPTEAYALVSGMEHTMGIAIGLLLVAAVALIRLAVTVRAGGFVVDTTGPTWGRRLRRTAVTRVLGELDWVLACSGCGNSRRSAWPGLVMFSAKPT